MPDATDLLIHDHREVDSLFERYESTQDPSVAEEICTELTVHAAAEEKVVYPVLGADVSGGKGMRTHAEQEHQEVKDLIFELEKVGPADPRARELMARVKQAVTDHVRDEETDVFPTMRRELGQDRLQALGQQLQEIKEQLLSEAAAGGPLIDLTKDKLYELAQQRGIDGRSEMSKAELISALRSA